MNHLSSLVTTLRQSVLESLLVIGIGLGLPTLAASLLWGFHYQLSIDWVAFWWVAALVWLTGHGVPAVIALDESWLTALGLGAEQSSFELSFALLGFALLTAYLAGNAGRRIAHHSLAWISALLAIALFAALSWLVAWSIPAEFAELSQITAIMLPTLWFAVPLLLSMLIERPELLGRWADSALDFVPTRMLSLLRDGALGATMAILMVFVVSGAAIAALVLLNGLEIVSLYESLHAGYLGGSILTVLQLFLLPNLVIWSLAWFAGPGFSIGIATQVSPLGTQLGPVPALPIFGAIPGDLGSWGFVAFIVPILAGFLTMFLLKQHSSGFGWQLGSAAAVGVASGILAGFLGLISSGSIGPGRMIEVGVDALQVGLWFGLLVLIGAVIGTLTRNFSRTLVR